MAQRKTLAEQLTGPVWDVCIVGGGINGAGILRDAVLRGMTACCLEKDDFASGTSSKSSKLIHGGVRYLEQFQFRLVYEALAERALWVRNAPHLVQPLSFMIPMYGSYYEMAKYRLGLSIYDVLAFFGRIHKHLHLSPRETLQLEPSLSPDRLKGSLVYADAMTDDSRLTIETVLDGVQHGGTAVNYCRVEHFERDAGGLYTVHVVDTLTGETATLQARSIANVTGAWADRFRQRVAEHGNFDAEHKDRLARSQLKPTKGVHIQIPGEVLPLTSSVLMFHPQDGRVMFAIPRGKVVICGTTDTYFSGNPDELHATREDVAYLRAALTAYFPAMPVRDSDIISTYAGLRPLINQESENASAASREHEIHEELPGFFTMVGGKYTTYRRMCEELTDELQRHLGDGSQPVPTKTASLPLYQGDFYRPDPEALELFGKDIGIAVWRRYGSNWTRLRDIVTERPELKERLSPDAPFLEGEVVLAARHELVTRLADLLVRRLSLYFFHRDQALSLAPRCAELLGEELGWDAQRRQEEIDAYAAYVAKSRAYRDEPTNEVVASQAS